MNCQKKKNHRQEGEHCIRLVIGGRMLKKHTSMGNVLRERERETERERERDRETEREGKQEYDQLSERERQQKPSHSLATPDPPISAAVVADGPYVTSAAASAPSADIAMFGVVLWRLVCNCCTRGAFLGCPLSMQKLLSLSVSLSVCLCLSVCLSVCLSL